jgi:hypothetical protein
MQMIPIIGFLLINLFYKGIVYYPQENVDYLREQLLNANQKERIELFNRISYSYNLIDLDSSVYYANQAIKEARKSNVPELIVLSYLHLAEAYNLKGNIDSVEKYADLSMNIAEEEDNMSLIAYIELDHAVLDYLQRKPLISAEELSKH